MKPLAVSSTVGNEFVKLSVSEFSEDLPLRITPTIVPTINIATIIKALIVYSFPQKQLLLLHPPYYNVKDNRKSG